MCWSGFQLSDPQGEPLERLGDLRTLSGFTGELGEEFFNEGVAVEPFEETWGWQPFCL